jgi:hypothetical protein
MSRFMFREMLGTLEHFAARLTTVLVGRHGISRTHFAVLYRHDPAATSGSY